MKDQLLLIDGSSYIFRAFYAVRAGLTNREGLPTNAVLGFKNMLLSLLEREDPSHCVVTFDTPGPNFRHRIYPLYKANREEAPDPLKQQFEPVQRFCRLLNLRLMFAEDCEADDLIGSLVEKFGAQIKATIVSGDKDLTQLVTDQTRMLDTMKDKLYTPEEVKEKFGVYPRLIPEYLALIGDSSDNIPGVDGIGPKTAVKLFENFGSLSGILQNTDKLKGKQKERIESSADKLEIGLKLTVIRRDLEIKETLDDCRRPEPDWKKLSLFYEEMNFRSDNFLNKYRKIEVGAKAKVSENGDKGNENQAGWNYDKYELVTDAERLKELLRVWLKQSRMVIDLETTSLNTVEAEIVGIALAWSEEDSVYIPVAHSEKKYQIPLDRVLEILRPLWEKEDLRFIGQNIKYDISVLANYDVFLKGRIHDTMIQSYLLAPNLQRHNLDYLADRHLGHQMIKYEEVAGKGKKQIPFADVPLEKALAYAAEDAEATWKIHRALSPRLKEEKLERLYEDIELPLCRLLAAMERHGVKIDVDCLEELRVKLDGDLEELRTAIYERAGEEFNINSPRQLSAVLFDKMGISIAKKKTKTGYSTNANVLERMALGEPIAVDLLAYRSKSKLINTYLDVLPSLISPRTGRIHTSYGQTTTATGRLSSSNPNLQNIPIKGKDGAKIREAFISEPGFVLLSVDYSQIELRFLAHFADDEGLIKVFEKNGDIHTETAAAIFDVLTEEVTVDQRRAAKAINFGIIYGMGAFRLSQEIKVSQKQAKAFIDSYFQRYSGIQTYIEKTIAFCKEHSYAETICGRKREIKDINSGNRIARAAAERMAMNSRIQGSAADLIKIAMIKVGDKLAARHPTTKMIMQVHDELVFEVEEREAEKASSLIKETMENSLSLKVPLRAEAAYGRNWQEAH